MYMYLFVSERELDVEGLYTVLQLLEQSVDTEIQVR